ncbi:hypothetical protein [Streptomyces sp. NPDC056543]|uniref:hypothetical protein n=1 Tax=unclassified Streptomyces TaxID=2593676 RepID=UPI0036B7EC4E
MDSALRDQIKSLHLFELCSGVLAADEVWSRSLNESSPTLDEWDRMHLARLARDMANDIAAIHEHADLVLRLLDSYDRAMEEKWHGLQVVSEFVPVLIESPGTVRDLVKKAVQHLASRGPGEIMELHAKARDLSSVEGGIPVGDVSRKTWAIISVIGGFAMLGSSIVMAAFGGPVGVAGGGAVLVLAGVMLTKAFDILTEED